MQRQQPNEPDVDVSQNNNEKRPLKLSHLKQIMKRFHEIEQEHNHSIELIIEDALRGRR